MVSMIKEINDNLKAILDNLKNNLDTFSSNLENIQIQMDKKVEEAKKYKIQVDSAKDKIRSLEEDNKTLELSLKELSDKYSKMNLVSLVEAGNREIRTKINDNLKEITKQKEHIADLTNKARTIKDLLINLKKDKTAKQDKLDSLKVIYEYYNSRISEVVDYAFDHSENLSDYIDLRSNDVTEDEYTENSNNVDIDIDNTMIFDEIASIDDNKNFKDEMSFISDQISNVNDEEQESEIEEPDDNETDNEGSTLEIEDEAKELDDDIEETDDLDDINNVFDSIIEDEIDTEVESDEESDEEDISDNEIDINDEVTSDDNEIDVNDEVTSENDDLDVNNDIIPDIDNIDLSVAEEPEEVESLEDTKTEDKEPESITLEDKPLDVIDNNGLDDSKLSIFDINEALNKSKEVAQELDESTLDAQNIERMDKIDNLFSSVNNSSIPVMDINGVENKIDNVYQDVFGGSINDPIKKDPTLTDIFGNPIKSTEINQDINEMKKLEETFVENGVDFNKFREDDQSKLKEIYDEEKFVNILNTLKRNQINLDNIYYASNIFGEITANELESIISKLINCGQSKEAIGLILEKLPKVKDYNLDEAIISYGDYVKNIDITELVMKAKELSNNGGNV